MFFFTFFNFFYSQSVERNFEEKFDRRKRCISDPPLVMSTYVEEEKDEGNQEEVIFEIIELGLESNDIRSDLNTSNTTLEKTSVSPYLSESLDFCLNIMWFGALGAVVVAFFILLSIVIRIFFFQ